MSFEYYYIKNDQQIGPVRLHQLLKDINGETLVWREGIDWSKAREVEELKSYFHEIVKEVIIEKPVEVIKEVIVEKKQDEASAPAKKNSSSFILYIVIGVIAAGAAYFFLKPPEGPMPPSKPEEYRPISWALRENVQKKGMITVGYMSIDHFDNEVRECLVTIVGNKPTKFKSIDSFDNLYKAMESKSIDIILLSRKEKNDWENILDVSGRFKILNLNGYYYIGFPKGNNAIIDKFNNCINQ